MTMWLAVLVLGLGSFALRVAPFLLGDRVHPSRRTELLLRHAAVAAVTALIVTGIRGAGQGDLGLTVVVTVALAAALALAAADRSMGLVILGGLLVYGVGVAASVAARAVI